MFYNAKNHTVTIDGDTTDFISFGKGKKNLVIIPGVGDGLKTAKGLAIPFAFMYRLFAKDFQFAVLDEPSSALDPIAEYKMYESLINVTKGKTVLYISHRLSSATRSDNILVFNNGELVEQGTHEELMANNGEYAEMFTLQASGYTQNEEVCDVEE